MILTTAAHNELLNANCSGNYFTVVNSQLYLLLDEIELQYRDDGSMLFVGRRDGKVVTEHPLVAHIAPGDTIRFNGLRSAMPVDMT